MGLVGPRSRFRSRNIQIHRRACVDTPLGAGETVVGRILKKRIRAGPLGRWHREGMMVDFGQTPAVIVLYAKIFPRHVIAEEVTPSPRYLGGTCKHLRVVDEGEYLGTTSATRLVRRSRLLVNLHEGIIRPADL